MSGKSLREDVIKYAKEKFGDEPDRPWIKYPENEVLRHSDNNKWYGLIMPVSYARLGLEREGSTDVLNVKCEPTLIGSLIAQGGGYLPAYHMNKSCWLSICLDGSVPLSEVYNMLSFSYELTM